MTYRLNTNTKEKLKRTAIVAAAALTAHLGYVTAAQAFSSLPTPSFPPEGTFSSENGDPCDLICTIGTAQSDGHGRRGAEE